jgi:hypothetical protein
MADYLLSAGTLLGLSLVAALVILLLTRKGRRR